MTTAVPAERTVPREPGPSPAAFRRDYVRRSRPLVLAGIASRWPAVSRWTPEFLRKEFPDARVRYIERDRIPRDRAPAERSMLELAQARERKDSTLGEFIERMSSDDHRIRYLIFSDLLDSHRELQRDIEPLDSYQLGRWLPDRVRSALRQKPLFWMGPASLTSPLHVETVNNLFVQIHGTKDWLLFPPTESTNLYFPWRQHPMEFLNWSPVDPEAPDLERFPRYRDASPWRVTVGPGDILFVPAGWWHHVSYRDPTISLTWFWHGPWSSTVGCRGMHLARLRRRLAPVP